MTLSDADRPRMRSAEGVELELPVAGPAPRMLAYAIDATLVWILLGVLLVIVLVLVPPLTRWLADFMTDNGSLDPKRAQAHPERFFFPFIVLLVLLSFFGELLYFVVSELLSGGSSIGKHLVGLRVVRTDGLRIDFRASLIRNLMRAVDILPSTYVIGLTALVLSRRGQRLGDHAAGTLVVRLDQPEQALRPSLPPGLTPLPLSRAQLENLGTRERALVRRTLRRARELEGARRDELLSGAARALSARLGLDEALVSDPYALLCRLWLTLEARER